MYAWVTGYIGGITLKAGNAIKIQSFYRDPDTGLLTVYVQNVGQGKVEFKAGESVYVDDIQVGITSPIQPLALGETAALVTNKVISEGEKVEIKVTTTNGISVTTTGIANANPTAPPNVAPVLGVIGAKSVNEGVLLTFTVSGTDADFPAQVLSYSATGVPTGATFTAATRTFSWTPTEAQGPGTYDVAFSVSDGAGGSDSEIVRITVGEVNVAPVLAAVGDKSVNEGVLLSFTVLASDADVPAQVLTYSATGLPSGASISGAGVFSWTPTGSQGSVTAYQITVRVTDDGAGALFDEETIAVTVAETNTAPVLAVISAQSVNEGSLLTVTPVASDVDVPAQTLTFSLQGTVPAGVAIDSATGVMTWTPSESQGGSAPSITIRVSDSGVPSLFAERTFIVTVGEVNVAPVLAAIGAKSVNEGVLLSFTVLASDADFPAQILTYSATGLPSGASISGAGVFSWTPTGSQGSVTAYQITVRVTDDGAGALFDEETIAVTVAETNTAPVLAVISAQSVNEGSLLTVTAVASDVDVPAQTLTFSLQGTVPAGVAIDSATGVMTWTPSESQGGSAPSITIRVSDSGVPSLFAERTFIVTVGEVNVAPVLAAIGAKSVNEGVLLTFTVLASDADFPAQALTYSATGLPSGASISGTGVFSWTPTGSQGSGTPYQITVRVTDDGAGALYDEETIAVTVAETNTAPVLAVISAQSVNEGSLLTVTAVASDIDVPAQTLTFSLQGTVPAGVAIDSATGVMTWTPSESQGGSAPSITIRVSDSGVPSLFAERTFTVTVGEVNVAPVLAAIGTKSVNEGVLLTFTVSATDADLPAQALTYSATGLPSGATFNAGTRSFSLDSKLSLRDRALHLQLLFRVTDNGVGSTL